MDGEFPDELKCPVCYNIPPKEIFQCKNGHMFCSVCSQNLKTCPQCRVVLEAERIRSLPIENMLEKMKFDCVNKPLGCANAFGRTELASHINTCGFR